MILNLWVGRVARPLNDFNLRVPQASFFEGILHGDAFPNTEVFVVNSKDQATMLDTFTTDGGRNSGPIFNLPGNNDRPMGAFSKCAAE